MHFLKCNFSLSYVDILEARQNFAILFRYRYRYLHIFTVLIRAEFDSQQSAEGIIYLLNGVAEPVGAGADVKDRLRLHLR